MARKTAKTYAQLTAEIEALTKAKENMLQEKCKTFYQALLLMPAAERLAEMTDKDLRELAKKFAGHIDEYIEGRM